MRSVADDDEWRVAPDRAEGPHRRIHAAGNNLLGAFLQFARLLDFTGHEIRCENRKYSSRT